MTEEHVPPSVQAARQEYPDLDIPDEAIVPTPKQREVFAAGEDEVLCGGAAGFGKTWVLQVLALGLNEPSGPAIGVPFYRAVIIRKSYPDLLDFRDRCMEMYPQIVPGVKWKESESTFIFPSGAKVILRHLKEESDVHWFQGQELQFIGWDELTHQPSPYGYEYLKSRLRSRMTKDGHRLNTYIRATTNPGGPGHEWVKEHWRIPDEGTETCFAIDIDVPQADGSSKIVQEWRRFIPARAHDNPHLDPTYITRLASLREDLRKGLLEGRWDIVDEKGIIYGVQMSSAKDSGRIVSLPVHTSIPVNTFWDIGRDTTAIWFHQHVDGWDNFIDYFAGSQLSIVPDIIQMLQSKNYMYAAHFVPFDAERKHPAAGEKTVRSLLENAGMRPVVVVPKIPNVGTGLELTRNVFGGCRFDKDKCAEGIKALRNYRFGWDVQKQIFTKEPLHNWASHGADAFRQFAQGYRKPAEPAQARGTEQQYSRRRRRGHRDAARNPSDGHIL